MKKYKVHKEMPKPPSAEDISKYKDFGKLSHRFEKMTKRSGKPLYKNPKVFIALVLLALLAWLIAEEFSSEDQKDQSRPKTEQNREG